MRRDQDATCMLGVTSSSGLNVNVPDSFERGMLLMWHVSGFMNVIVGSRLPSDIFIREMKGVPKIIPCQS